MQRQLFLIGERFVEEASVVQALLLPEMCVVDVGANIGYYLLMFQRSIGISGRVLCFEPEPENADELRANIRENGLRNVTVFERAVGAEDGRVAFARGVNGMVVGRASHHGDDLVVPVVSLDSVIDETVDVIKIDVEGYEGHVLDGAERIIREQRPRLFVEIHPWMLVGDYTVRGILQSIERYYSDIQLYEKRCVGSALDRVVSRYARRGAVVRIRDRVPLLQKCDSGERATTFWVVCRP